MKELKLEDLTKAELIALIKNRMSPFAVSQVDLLEVRWHTLKDKSSEFLQRSIEQFG